MSIREKLSGAISWLSGATGEKRAEGETGIAFVESKWALWGIKPYRADDLLKSKALRLEVYRDLMREPVVKAAILNRTFAAMTLAWDVRVPGADRREKVLPDDPRKQAQEFIRNILGEPEDRWPKLIFDLSQALRDGFAIIEKVYGVIEDGPFAGKIGVERLAAKDVDTWDFECDEFMRVTKLKQQVWGVWEDRDPSKFIVFSWLPAFENPLGQSEFRAAYRAAWLKDSTHKFRAMYLEVLAKARRKVTYQADQGADGLKKAQKLLDVMENSIGMALPSDLQIELLEVAVAPTEAFESAQARYDKEIVIGLEGAVLQMLEGSNTGAFRATETHRAVTEPWARVLGIFLQAAIQKELVADLVKLNFAGLAAPPKVYFRWTRADLADLAAILKTLVVDCGAKVPAWYIYEEFSIPQPEEGDEILERQAAPAFITAGTGNGERGTGKDENAAAMADAGDEADPRDELIARAVARAPEAYRSLFENLKKKARKNFVAPLTR